MHAVIRFLLAFTTLFLLKTHQSFGQEGYELKLKKPQKYENRKLGYENTYTKKLGVKRKFIQNTVTHYNYYYNANLKLDNVIAQAKAGFVDDFTKLLPFYNYDLNTTAGAKSELDSVIYKATAGIVLHDLRNDWIDNLYYLIGKAYFLKKETDSAAITFQFLNNAFAPRDKDGYTGVIASNASPSGNSFTIATKEKQSLAKRVLSMPPSRNDALIWMVRTAIEQQNFAKAASLLQALRNDPAIPARLQAPLAEMNALYFYKQNIADSAAYYLEKALPVAQGTVEKSRWQFLIGQLYEQVQDTETAIKWYNAAIKTTINPILDIYARLNAIRLNKTGGDNFIQENIEALYKMARKDNYSSYRDIIYYTAGIMDIERKNTNGAVNSFLRSLHFNTENLPLKNQAFVELGNQYFLAGAYKLAKSAYDSLDLAALGQLVPTDIQSRKDALAILIENTEVIERQDSLQALAAMPETEREALLVQTLKAFQKSNAKKSRNNQGNHVRTDNIAADLFANNTKGEWYFYNKEVSAKGLSDFTAKWGTRANADNWRRSSALNRSNLTETNESNTKEADLETTEELTYESLLAPIPLSPEQMRASNDSIMVAQFNVAEAYQVHLEDYAHAVFEYEALLAKFPETKNKDNIYFNLYYCYWKLGLLDKADRYKQALNAGFPGSPFTLKLAAPGSVKDSPETIKKEATALYEKIYLHFIEGQFATAIALKKEADSIYGNSYWTPQLLYIEAVYHIKERQDAQAIVALDNIIQTFGMSLMLPKAEKLKDVLLRRDEIEGYLTNLEITRNVDSIVKKRNEPVTQSQTDIAAKALQDSIAAAQLLQQKKDSLEQVLALQQEQTRRDSLEKQALALQQAQARKDSLANLQATLELDRLARTRDSLERQAIIAQKAKAVKDSIEKQVAIIAAQQLKRSEDSMKLQAIALQKLQASKDSIAREQAELELARLAHAKDSIQKQVIAQQKLQATKDSLAKQQAALELAQLARTKDSIAQQALALKQQKARQDSIARQALALAKQKVIDDSIAQKQALVREKAIRDSMAQITQVREKTMQDSILKAEALEAQRKAAQLDSLQKAAAALKKEANIFTFNNFTFEPKAAYYVLLVFNKVDPVYVSESRNAFNRYNREEYNKANISLEPLSLTDTTKLLVFKNFENLATAEAYKTNVTRKVALEIVPWLPIGKYSFHLITDKNLQELMRAKNLPAYLEFWEAATKEQKK